MFGFGKKKEKRSAVVFVDYEHWFYGYNNIFHMRPNFTEWLTELKKEFDVTRLYVFGDFSEKIIGEDLQRLQKETKDVVHTASMKDGVDKDFTDVIILDYIYRSAAAKNSPETYVLFTGDAHFTRVVEYLKETGKKVIIYGVKRSFSNALKSAATSYVEMPRQEQERNHYNELILTSLSIVCRKPKKIATYQKTIDTVAEYNKVPADKVKTALDGLISQKYVVEKEHNYSNGKSAMKLVVDWKRVHAAKLM